jgi:GNAT superfamily N-acetyltransferase
MHHVCEYTGGRDEEIASFILGIQNDEAGLNLTIAEQPDLIDIFRSYQKGGFWLALSDDRIVGTIGLLPFGRRGAIKKFFVAPEFRGHSGPARALFDCVLNVARLRGYSDLFLDTPRIATRSHAFYAREGFAQLSADQLPPEYEFPDRDSLIFGLSL